ncbi:MAG: hydroxymethylglutaryl-CoA lyase [Bacteroidia bacterium]|nr:hydroxymethylglutaryl-CoA lyase [Bacteroidia bacterium]
MSHIQLTECPRDAMQGIKQFIPTQLKIDYLNALLQCNFDVLDFGSFVSTKAIPQLQDTAQVLSKLNFNERTKLLAIVANERGAQEACAHNEITFLGFPFSVSETFQLRNTNTTIDQSLHSVEAMQDLCTKHNKQLLVYLSMAFGNPYGDVWHQDIVTKWAETIANMGIQHIALADTIGCSTPQNITPLFSTIIPELPKVAIGAHLHSTASTINEKINATIQAGCTRIDTAIKGYGGCPMATDELTGNTATEVVLNYLQQHSLTTNVDTIAFNKALVASGTLFDTYH